MFTIDQIKDAHSKVKSGIDFPAYIKAIKNLGVTNYEAFVTDGHINYYGDNHHTAKVQAKYKQLIIAESSNKEAFKAELLAHQQGQTDFPTFIKMCASVGVDKWIVDLEKMTCTYFDKIGNEVLVEQIKG